jgi:formyl-CoA transferase
MCSRRTSRPGAIERLGLGYEVLSAGNEGLIYAQVKGFGEGSPVENNLAFDMIAQAVGGVMSIRHACSSRSIPGKTRGRASLRSSWPPVWPRVASAPG